MDTIEIDEKTYLVMTPRELKIEIQLAYMYGKYDQQFGR